MSTQTDWTIGAETDSEDTSVKSSQVAPSVTTASVTAQSIKTTATTSAPPTTGKYIVPALNSNCPALALYLIKLFGSVPTEI